MRHSFSIENQIIKDFILRFRIGKTNFVFSKVWVANFKILSLQLIWKSNWISIATKEKSVSWGSVKVSKTKFNLFRWCINWETCTSLSPPHLFWEILFNFALIFEILLTKGSFVNLKSKPNKWIFSRFQNCVFRKYCYSRKSSYTVEIYHWKTNEQNEVQLKRSSRKGFQQF